ncbi:hypothetical protein EBT16_13535, partial [bacterium]|nr:hypothetical protein [bacterium]
DSSIFDESGSSGSEEVEVKRIRQPLKEPRLRADRRTRFRRDPDLVYPGPYGDDDYEDHRVYRQDTQSPEPDDDYYNQTTTLQNVRIQNEQPRSVAVPPPPPVNPPVYSYEQLRNENPLFSRIFG